MVGINTNIAAYYAQANIGKASAAAGSSISRLSSGNRIVQAKDDVAALSAGTSLRTAVTTLRRALINTSQGTSLLQVADGALSQVTDILQRQKAIAVQASGGTLTDSDRTFLNQEFQSLTQEVDRLAGQTNFNGVSLLNGALSTSVAVKQSTAIGASASATITLNQNQTTASTALVLNGVTVTVGTTPTQNVNLGTSVQGTLDNLVTYLNSQTSGGLADATYARNGSSLVITAKAGGSIGETYKINNDLATSTFLSASGAGTGTRIGVVSGQYQQKLTTVLSGFTQADTTTASAVTAAATAGSLLAGAAATFQANGNAGTAVNLTSGALTAGQTLSTVVTNINANTAATGITARIEGYSGAYSIVFERNYNPATAGNETTVAFVSSGAAVANVTPGAVINSSVVALDGGTDLGLSAGRTIASGTIGNSILSGQNQSAASTTIAFPAIADSDLLTTANFGTQRSISFNAGPSTVSFGFVNRDAQTVGEVKIGATLSDTLDNLVSSYNTYAGSVANNYSLQQTEAHREGNNVVITRKDVGNVSTISGGNLTVSALPGISGVSQLGSFTNGSNTGGVNTTGITNTSFVGKVQGFTASYTGTNNTATLSIKVGNNTYTASNVVTNPTTATSVRFSSQDGGGFFDVQQAANAGQTVASQSDAQTIADRFNSAFASLTFNQERNVSSYTGNSPILTNGVVTGSLIGTRFDIQDSDFSATKIDSISVTAPSGSSTNGSISISLGGETYNSINNIGSKLGANGVYRLTSTTDATHFIDFHTGATGIDFGTKAKADAFAGALKTAFGVGNGSANLVFQVGTTTSDTLAVSIGDISSKALYNGNAVDVLTQTNALAASDAIDTALKAVTSVRSNVGALQSRFDFAAANIQSSIQNQDAARGVLLDTDVAAESTAYATSQVQLQAGISVLAQANQLPQNLLKLIG